MTANDAAIDRLYAKLKGKYDGTPLLRPLPVKGRNPKTPKPKPPLERVVQKQIVAYLKAAGWSVWQTSVGNKHPSGAKGLRVTPGIPDLYARHRRYGAIWVEVKREGGTFSEAQKAFDAEHDGIADHRDNTGAKPPVFWVHSLQQLRVALAGHGMGIRP